MGLRVESGALEEAAAEYDRAVGGLAATVGYHDRYADFGVAGTGFIVMLNQTHDVFQDLLRTRLTDAARLLELSAHELRAAGTVYAATDSRVAALLDATYPLVARGAFTAGGGW